MKKEANNGRQITTQIDETDTTTNEIEV